MYKRQDKTLLRGVSYLKRVQGKLYFDMMSTEVSNDPMLTIGSGIVFDLGGFFDIVFPISVSMSYYYSQFMVKVESNSNLNNYK